jgi:hypothetical protein
VDLASEAAGYLKTTDPWGINFIGAVVTGATVRGINGNFCARFEVLIDVQPPGGVFASGFR